MSSGKIRYALNRISPVITAIATTDVVLANSGTHRPNRRQKAEPIKDKTVAGKNINGKKIPAIIDAFQFAIALKINDSVQIATGATSDQASIPEYFGSWSRRSCQMRS